jgi:two-component system chemotaxis sensor kinase CheA
MKPDATTATHELLGDMENALLTVDMHDDRTGAVDSIEQAATTISALANAQGQVQLVGFISVMQRVFADVRSGKLGVAAPLVVLLLSCCEHIGQVAAAGGRIDTSAAARTEALSSQLNGWLDGTLHTGDEAERAAHIIAAAGADSSYWCLSLHLGPQAREHGVTAASLVQRLSKIGNVVAITPPLEGDDEVRQASFDIAFETCENRSAIEAVFDDVKQDCLVYLVPPNSRAGEYVRLIRDMPEQSNRLGEILVRCGIVTEDELNDALASQRGNRHSAPLGSILFGQGTVPAQVVTAALARQQQS